MNKLVYMTYVSLQMRNEALKAGSAPARESIWQYFVSKCSNNLHIVMAMSPVGDTLRTRCRNFPGMVNNASIDWFFPWPDQALFAVASTFISPDVSHTVHRSCVVCHFMCHVICHVMSFYSSHVFLFLCAFELAKLPNLVPITIDANLILKLSQHKLSL